MTTFPTLRGRLVAGIALIAGLGLAPAAQAQYFYSGETLEPRQFYVEGGDNVQELPAIGSFSASQAVAPVQLNQPLTYYYLPQGSAGFSGYVQPQGWQVLGQPTVTSYQTSYSTQVVTPATTTTTTVARPGPAYSSFSMGRLMQAMQPYLALRAGMSRFEDTSFDITGSSVTSSYEDQGLTGSVAFGSRFSDGASPVGFRLEAELGGKRAAVAQHSILTGATTTVVDDSNGVTGETQALFGFVNGFADFGFASGLGAFVGGGVGYGQISLTEHGQSPTVLMDNSANTFGYQGMAGLSYAFSPNMAVEGAVRYQRFNPVEFEAVDSTKTDVELSSMDFLVGLRFSF